MHSHRHLWLNLLQPVCSSPASFVIGHFVNVLDREATINPSVILRFLEKVALSTLPSINLSDGVNCQNCVRHRMRKSVFSATLLVDPIDDLFFGGIATDRVAQDLANT